MANTFVLVVHDSVVIRRLFTDELSADSTLEISVAATGKIALSKLGQGTFDLVILDEELADMGGRELLPEIRRLRPNVWLMTFSELKTLSNSPFLDALKLPANDVAGKSGLGAALVGFRQFLRDSLLPAIKQRFPANRVKPPDSTPPPKSPPARIPRATRATGQISAVVIASSTGGPNALREVFQSLPSHLPVPVLIVQHMPPVFTRLLAERLTAMAQLPAEEATHGAWVQPGRAFLAPGDYHLTLEGDAGAVQATLNQDQPENSCRPAADPLFRSAARIYGAGVLAVVLTGMGSDGVRGCAAVREAGGTVLAQDEATSVVWGMPGAAARAGYVNELLPLPKIGREITRRVLSSRKSA